jgi:hypothetical protein
MPISSQVRPVLAAALLPLLAVGCGPQAPKLAPVQGRVFYQGTALRGGTIVFTPDASRGGRGPLAGAEIQPDGRFVLRTGDECGAVAGWHRITVLAVELPAEVPAGQRYAVPRSLLPQKYCDPELSGLFREVKPGRENTFDLYLD